ncbi:ABC transporter ATP-binding protein [Thiomonas sp. FB-Cd]|uniref:ABC transporter ATP-binding protein n=1 Tax=Thiomonas sp. FB-Cd TaxID=1158292 RepID=UPI0004DF5CCC|nr:dipeptide ABC transporter ATP-binding protein [Thiomonas sp. FB-Cd]
MTRAERDAPSGGLQPVHQPPLLRVQNLHVAFGTKEAVSNLSFDLFPGEKYALVGESGSGKTITALSILGLLSNAHSSGHILFDGRDLMALPEREMRDVRGRDIAMIFQEPMSALNPLQPIGRQIAESLELHEGLSRKAAWTGAVELLARMEIGEPARRANSFPYQLSGGQRQRAMIAMAVACKPRLLLADEPTTALDMGVRAQILALLGELQREYGLAVMLITHDLHLVRGFAQRIGVMRRGQLVEQGAMGAVFAQPRHPYTQTLLASLPHRNVRPLAADAPIVLRAQSLRVQFPAGGGWLHRRHHTVVRDVSLDLRAGETLGLVGQSGSGKTTLAMALLGLQAITGGEVRLGGVKLSTLNARGWRQARRKIQVVFQDPFSSLSPRRTIEQIVGEGLMIHAPGLSAEERRTKVVESLSTMQLEAGVLPRFPHEFSGGQRQRIALARALIVEPAVLILDEPTSALDISVQHQILQLLTGLQEQRGLAYLFITHDLAVIAAMAHRIAVMHEGQVLEMGEAKQLLHEPQHPYTRQLVNAAALVFDGNDV